MHAAPAYVFFLGGHDLEMVEIARLLSAAGLQPQLHDKHLAWGAQASHYAEEIAAALHAGHTPVLVELADNLPPEWDRRQWIEVDHHGARAGADRPSSLRQVYDLIAPTSPLPWTRHHDLVAANDIGHAAALRALGASAQEIRTIRDADRAAQGITPAIETESRRALAAAEKIGPLFVVETTAPTSSAIADFLLPEYGGPGECDVLVLTSRNFAFYGAGTVIAALASIPGCWYGGALPARGFWGAPIAAIARNGLIENVISTLNAKI